MRVRAMLASMCVLAVAGTVRYAEAGGSPPANTVSWILIGGKNLSLQGKSKSHPDVPGNAGRLAGEQIGLQLHSPILFSQVVPDDLNPTTGADGFVAGPGPFKDCAYTWHYHGSLFGHEDTGDACGWGEAIPFDMASDSLGFLVSAGLFMQ